MTDTSGFEGLSNELFTCILCHISSQHDLNNLSQTSRTLYHRTIPALYNTWSYHGLAQNPSDNKPWRKFLETINWRPDLGAHVREVDLREWGDCPRLEEYVGYFWEGHEEREAIKAEKLRERLKGTLGEDGGFWEDEESDEMDGGWKKEVYEGGSEDQETSDDGDEDEEYECMDCEDVEENELAFLGPSRAEREENVDAMFLKAGAEMGFERAETILGYANILYEEDEDKLVVMLLSKLPNLQKMWIVIPEDSGYDLEANVLHKFLDDTEGLKAAGILQQLETLYICSPLREMDLGGKDHREYTLDLKQVFPFMRLPKLKTLYTLTANCFDDPYNFPPIDYTPLVGTSNLTTLVYDEAELPCQDTISSLSIPKSLQHFRWTGEITCFSIGTCYAPFQDKLGDALRKHKESFESLYLDIRHNFCREAGHHANPHANMAETRRVFSDNFASRWERKRGLKEAVLIGSFKDFRALKSLAIHVTSLVGHQHWAVSETSMIDLLPPTLENLTLFIAVSIGAEGEWLFDNQLWYSQFLGLIKGAGEKLPRLKKIELSLVKRGAKGEREGSEVETEKTGGQGVDLFLEAVRECVDVKIELEIGNASPHGETTIPYFLEQTKDRNPGRDF